MIKTVGVVGCGQMGGGIAQVAAEAGYAVVVREMDQAVLDRGRQAVEERWRRAVERGKMTAGARDQAAANMRGTVRLEELRACDLILEAIVENLEAKQQVFAELDALCPPATLLATNTSAIPVIDIAMATRRPDRVCGLHFFNPVPAMALVEVARTLCTADATVAAATEFVRALGKRPVATRDSVGFIVNRLLVPYLLDAIRALELGVASIEDIDIGMTLGCAHPMGPLTLLDFIGLDTVASIAHVMHAEFREPRYAPPPLLLRMVRAGLLGKKSGRGFYAYAPGAAPVPATL